MNFQDTLWELCKDDVMAPVQEIDLEISQELDRFHFVLEKLFTASAIESAFVMVLLVALSFAVSKFAANRITQPISALTKAVHQIASGKVHTGDELENLAVCFNLMTDELISYMNRIERHAQEKERTRTELVVARKIQASLLPRKFPAFPQRSDFDIYASMSPAKAVGGDFYDFYLLDDNHVSGYGVPAALNLSSKILLSLQR